MFDPEKFGEAMGQAIRKAIAPLEARIKELEAEVGETKISIQLEKTAAQSAQEAYIRMRDEPHIEIQKAGEPGKDGIGMAGAFIDRDGVLQITMTNGEVKSLGVVVGKDGANGKDGISLESFDMEYLADSHEIALKASANGRTKELRYPAGGIHAKGYWREGTRAKAGDAWVNDGSLWIAVKDCQSQPGLNDGAWIIAARKGKDGERGLKGDTASKPAPIKLGA